MPGVPVPSLFDTWRTRCGRCPALSHVAHWVGACFVAVGRALGIRSEPQGGCPRPTKQQLLLLLFGPPCHPCWHGRGGGQLAASCGSWQAGKQWSEMVAAQGVVWCSSAVALLAWCTAAWLTASSYLHAAQCVSLLCCTGTRSCCVLLLEPAAAQQVPPCTGWGPEGTAALRLHTYMLHL